MAHDDEKPEAGDDPWAGLGSEGAPELGGEFSFSFEEQVADTVDAGAGDLNADVGAAPEAAGDAEIDDWLSGGPDGDAAASSVLATGVNDEAEAAGGEPPDFSAGESSVTIGTGTSGILSASGIDALGDVEPAASGDEADPFAGLSAEPMDWASAEPPASGDDQAVADAADQEPVDDFGAFDVAGAAVAGAAVATAGSDEPKRPVGKAARPAPPRKQKPSAIGQMIGVVLGGAMAIPITLGILIWGFGKDPFNVTPMLPESLAFLLPQKFRPSAGLPKFPSFDSMASTPSAAQSEPVDDGEASLPSADDLVGTEPEPQPEPTDLASSDPVAPIVGGEPAADPAMDLLDEPAAPPEPEPLDLAKLGAAIADAQAALEAVTAVDDPADPVRRRLLAKWYFALAGYAEELAALERLAAETGRPFEPAEEQAAAIRAGLADHPQLVAELSRLTREWIAYEKRSRDGVVMPATFVLAGRVGPYWRSQVTLPATDKLPERNMVVLTRTEPAVAPGDQVMIVGLAVDADVIWASELRSVAGAGFPGL